MAIIIRPVESINELHACEELQHRVWAMSDNLEVVPLHLLLTVQSNGGLLLGAFAGDELLGFVFGFLGLTAEGKLKHYSHMMAVAPEAQSSGIGYRLKLAQREFALAQGHDLVTWTYDPLESRNAYLNVHKLGAVCRTYYRDYYGQMADGLNAGLPTDRLGVEWWITSERVRQRLAGEAIPPAPEFAVQVNRAGYTATGLLTPGSLILDADAPVIRVEIPADYQAVKATDPNLALEWRLATRTVLETYLAAGYVVVGFQSHQARGDRRSFYILQSGQDEPWG